MSSVTPEVGRVTLEVSGVTLEVSSVEPEVSSVTPEVNSVTPEVTSRHTGSSHRTGAHVTDMRIEPEALLLACCTVFWDKEQWGSRGRCLGGGGRRDRGTRGCCTPNWWAGAERGRGWRWKGKGGMSVKIFLLDPTGKMAEGRQGRGRGSCVSKQQHCECADTW